MLVAPVGSAIADYDPQFILYRAHKTVHIEQASRVSRVATSSRQAKNPVDYLRSSTKSVQNSFGSKSMASIWFAMICRRS